MTKKNLKVLMLEDMKMDQQLIKRQVLKIDPDTVFTIASNKKEFEEKIEWGNPDVILSDYNLPGYNGVAALLLAKEKRPHIPFVFITGMLNNEEKVAETVLQGAAGYILKDNLAQIKEKLPQILEKSKDNYQRAEALVKKKRRRELLIQKLEELLHQTADFKGKKEITETLKEIRS